MDNFFIDGIHIFFNFCLMVSIIFLPPFYICQSLRVYIPRYCWLIYAIIYFISVNINYIFETLIFILYFYCIFRFIFKNDRPTSFFYSSYIVLSYDTIHRFFQSILNRLLNFDEIYTYFFDRFIMIRFIEYTIPLVLLILLFNLINLDFEIVKMKAFKNYVYVGNFIFSFMLLSITIWTLILQYNLSVIKIFGPTVALAHFVLFLFLAQYMKSQQRIYEANLEVIRREEENRNLNKFVDKLGDLYEDLRGIRHDFASIISSLEPAIQEKNIDEVSIIYKEVLIKMNRNLQKNEYSAFNLKNIEDLAIRNMLAQSILEAEQYDIQFNCYVSGHISQVNVPMLEMIQILSIMLTNSIESAIISKKPLIEVALYRDKNIVTIVIKNSRNPISLDKRTIWEVGVSSKGEGRGIGLYNLRRLVNRHDNLTLETQIDYDSFTHILKIM